MNVITKIITFDADTMFIYVLKYIHQCTIAKAVIDVGFQLSFSPLLILFELCTDLTCQFETSGPESDVDDALLDMWEQIKTPALDVEFNGETYKTLEQMTVNSQDYYGADGPPPEVKVSDRNFHFLSLLMHFWCTTIAHMMH